MNWILNHWQEIMFWAGIVLAIGDVVAGALPQSWVKYTGVILNLAERLKKFDVKKAGTTTGVLLICFVMAGCAALPAGTESEPTTCDQVTNSWICDQLAAHNLDPANVRDTIIDVDLLALSVSTSYNKTNALEFTQRIREFRDQGITYRYLISWLHKNTENINGTTAALASGGIIVLSRRVDMFDATDLIRDDDWMVIVAMCDAVDKEVNRYF